jgi:hypothetical protein
MISHFHLTLSEATIAPDGMAEISLKAAPDVDSKTPCDEDDHNKVSPFAEYAMTPP